MARLGSKNVIAGVKRKVGAYMNLQKLLKKDKENDKLMDIPTLEKDITSDKKLLAQKKMTLKDISSSTRPKSMAPTSSTGHMRSKDIKYGSRKK